MSCFIYITSSYVQHVTYFTLSCMYSFLALRQLHSTRCFGVVLENNNRVASKTFRLTLKTRPVLLTFTSGKAEQ